MDFFQLEDGSMQAEGVPLERIAAEVGTPAYVYSAATLRRHAKELADAGAAMMVLELMPSDVAAQVEHLLSAELGRRGFPARTSPLYAQMLVGMVSLTGQWWLDSRGMPREEVAAHLVNLAWHGLTGLQPDPELTDSRSSGEQDG